jgi:hypothetical protein
MAKLKKESTRKMQDFLEKIIRREMNNPLHANFKGTLPTQSNTLKRFAIAAIASFIIVYHADQIGTTRHC